MVLSYTVPCHRRVADWQAVAPTVWQAMVVGAPVELVLVDYGNPVPLGGATVRVDAAYYHMAHARNVGIRAATGDVVMIGSTDIRLHPETFAVVRRALATGAVWAMPVSRYLGLVAVQRAALLALGGYDERFEFYGPEDTDLQERLERRYGAPARYPDGYLSCLPTPDAVKVQHYRLPLTKREMHQRGKQILLEHRAHATQCVNEGLAWGSIQPPSSTTAP